jgi:hypothetical protein
MVALLIGCAHKFDPIEARDIRASAIVVGSAAPEAQLVRPSGSKVALSELTRDNTKTVVVFYRGFF